MKASGGVERKRKRGSNVPAVAEKPCESSQWAPPVRDASDYASIRQDLDNQGVAVVGNILSPLEQEHFEAEFWEAITKRCARLKRDDRSTWTPENYVWKGNYGAGQYKHYGMAQEKHCWSIRKNVKIRDVFEQGVFQGEDCCVSLDGAAALFEPTESKLELHVDLVPNLPGADFGSVQGAYNLYEVATEGTRTGACFMCVPGSHKEYYALWQAAQAVPGFKQPSKHWMVLDSASPLQHQAVKVITPANSLVLWKSELQHKNYGGDFTVAELGRMCRLVQFVAWQPRRFRTEAVRDKKIQCVKDGVCTSHWAALCQRNPVKPFPPWGKHTIPIILPFDRQKPLPQDIEALL